MIAYIALAALLVQLAGVAGVIPERIANPLALVVLVVAVVELAIKFGKLHTMVVWIVDHVQIVAEGSSAEEELDAACRALGIERTHNDPDE